MVDINRREVLKLIDTGVVPIPQAPADFDPAAVGTLRPAPTPLVTSLSHGADFALEGHEVRWQRWRLHVRLDIRVGPVVSLVRYDDHSTLRSILYQGSLSELFVPYMDPDTGWYFRTYMDAGEYGVGKFTPPLQVGVDCPAYATYMEAVLADDKGVPSSQPNAVCLFERTAGDIAWRHFEIVHGQTESRRGRELVMRYIAAIGNYDYFFDWVFRQDGSINIAVGTSGIEQVQAVTAPVMAEAQPTEDLAYGHLVAPHTLAIHHDHFFNFRLDLSVDSTQNSLLIGELTPVALGLESPRRSTYTVRSRVAKTEQEAKLHVSTDRPALWRVINPQRSGPLGYPVSYQLVASHPAMSLLSPQDYPQRRAGFTGYYLWVTPFHPEERYARGMYPSQSHGGDGLPHWTQANRAVDNADIVLRYTLGLHHVVRAEDWPVMPTVWHGFELRPFDFFARNPALDLPR